MLYCVDLVEGLTLSQNMYYNFKDNCTTQGNLQQVMPDNFIIIIIISIKHYSVKRSYVFTLVTFRADTLKRLSKCIFLYFLANVRVACTNTNTFSYTP